MFSVQTPCKRGFEAIAEIYPKITELGGVIAGSYPAWCATEGDFPPAPHDLDIFPVSQEAHTRLQEYLGTIGTAKRTSDTAITYDWTDHDLEIQLIRVLNDQATTAETILDGFDFTVARAAFVTGEQIMVDLNFLDDMRDRRLMICEVKHPVGQVYRVGKYMAKGFRIDPVECLKLFITWDKLDAKTKAEISIMIADKTRLFEDETFLGFIPDPEVDEIAADMNHLSTTPDPVIIDSIPF